jgi:hypothetical protein
MTIAHATQGVVTTWSSNWAWGLPLIVLTLIIHVFGLFLIKEKAEHCRAVRHHPEGLGPQRIGIALSLSMATIIFPSTTFTG